MEELETKQLRKMPGFEDLRRFRLLAQRMRDELTKAEKTASMELMLNVLEESLGMLKDIEKQSFSAGHPVKLDEVFYIYEHIYTNIREFHYFFLLRQDPTLKALHTRAEKLGGLGKLKEKLVSALADVAMLSLNEGRTEEQKIDEMIEAQKRLNELRNVIFSYVASSHMWTSEMTQEYENLLNSTAVDSVTAQLMVSAITLSCLYLFDRKKFQLLFELSQESTDLYVRARAWVGWLLCTSQIPGFMVEECAKDIESLKDDEEGKQQLLLICKLLLRSQDMEGDSEAMMNSMLHEMADKIGHIENDDFSDSEGQTKFSFVQKNDDEMEEGNPLDETVGMLDEGADIYFQQFRETKKQGFFHSMYNWFMPFYFESPLYLSVLKKAGDKERNLLLLLKNGTTCDSDRYSLLLMLEKEKESFEKALASLAPDEMTEECLQLMTDEKKGKLSEEERKKIEQRKYRNALVYYIQDLSRFFNLAPMRKAYDNSIKVDSEDQVYTPLILPVFKDCAFDGLRYKLAKYCFRRKYIDLIFSLLGDHYQETLENHYMLAWAAVNSETDSNLVLAYPHIDFLMKEAPEQFQLVELAVDFYEKAGFPQKAVDCLKHLMEIKKDDEKAVRWCKKHLAKAYVMQEQYDDAVKLLYEITYLEPDNLAAVGELAEALLYKDGDGKENLSKVHEKVKSALDRLHDQRWGDFNMDNFPDNLKEGMATFFSAMAAAMDMDFLVDFELHKLNGMLYWAGGDRVRAMKAWRSAYESSVMAHHEDQFFDGKQQKWLAAHGVNNNMCIYLVDVLAQNVHQGVKKMMDGFGEE